MGEVYAGGVHVGFLGLVDRFWGLLAGANGAYWVVGLGAVAACLWLLLQWLQVRRGVR